MAYFRLLTVCCIFLLEFIFSHGDFWIFGLSSKLQVFFNTKMLSQEYDLRTVNFFDSVLLKTKDFDSAHIS